jgi:uncharacterized membrane protein
MLVENDTINVTSASYTFTVQKDTPNATIDGNTSKKYQFSITNNGNVNDTYNLSVIGGNWSYSIRNAGDTQDISSLYVENMPEMNEYFSIKVHAPITAAQSSPDTITVRVASQGNPNAFVDTQVVTSISNYSFSLTSNTSSMAVYPNNEYTYTVTIANTGTSDDTYNLTKNVPNFAYEYQSITNTQAITQLSVPSGLTRQFLVKFTPTSGTSSELYDTLIVYAQSQGDSTQKNIQMQSLRPSFNWNMFSSTNYISIAAGSSYSFYFTISNTGSGNDTYTLTNSSGNWTYSIYSATEYNQPLTAISVNALTSAYFWVKATVPGNIAGGQSDFGMIRATSSYCGSPTYKELQLQISTPTVKTNCANLYFDTPVNPVYAVPGEVVYHSARISVNDDGSSIPDTYTLTVAGGNWKYTVRDQSNTTDISTLLIENQNNCMFPGDPMCMNDPGMPGMNTTVEKYFIVAVEAPSTGVNQGDSDSCTLTVTSHKYPGCTYTKYKTTSVSLYNSFAMAVTPSQLNLTRGEAKDYLVTITNSGSLNDTYDITLSNSANLEWTYTICNQSGTTIDAITVNSNSTETFFVRALIPDYATGPKGLYPTITGTNRFLAYGSILDGITDFTVEAWVYPTSFSKYSAVMDFGNGINNGNILLATSSDWFGQAGYGKPCLYLNNNNSSYQLDANQTINLNEWVHLAATFTGTTANLYINGVLDNSGTSTVTPYNGSRSQRYIGYSPIQNASLNGSIDDFRIWNVARTQTQIQQNMDIELNGNETGLIAYWKFNDPVENGQPVYDEVNNNFATNNYCTWNISSKTNESPTIKITSQGNSVHYKQQQVNTYLYESNFSLTRYTTDQTVDPGSTTYYQMQITNQGTSDNFTLTTSGGSWEYTPVQYQGQTTATRSIYAGGNGGSTSFYVQAIRPLSASGSVDTVTLTVTPSSAPSSSKFELITTTVNTIACSIQRLTNQTITLDKGHVYDYPMQIQNTGFFDDSYTLTLSPNSSFSYTLMNATGTQKISQLTVSAGQTYSFVVRVTVPNNATDGYNDNVYVYAKSHADPTITRDTYFTTWVPSYSFEVYNNTGTQTVAPGQSATFAINIYNQSTTDTYDLTLSSGNFSYTIGDSTNTSEISTISLPGDSGQNIFVNVTVPTYGVSSAQSENVALTVASQASSSAKRVVYVTTNTPSYSFNMTNFTGSNITILGGQTQTYSFQLSNNSDATDSYTLSILSADSGWSYSILNASANALTDTITLTQYNSQNFVVEVEAPANPTNGESSSITVHAVSHANNFVSQGIGITTMTPSYAFTASPITNTTMVYPGLSFSYNIQVQNTGTYADTYFLSTQGGLFSYNLRNSSNTAAITQLTLGASSTDSFIAQVTVPLTVANAGSDTVSISLTSSALPSVSGSLQLTTTTPSYAFNIGTLTNQRTITPGESFNYSIYVHNSGSGNDTYTLAVAPTTWITSIRDITDSSDINTLSVASGLTASYIVKVTVPTTGLTNGESKTITVNVISFGDSSISNSEQLTSVSPIYSYTTQLQNNTATINPGQSHYYSMSIKNTGTANDTYDLSLGSGSFSYVIRNSFDNATLRTVSLDAGYSETVLVKVSVPLVGIANGQSDSITIHTLSQSVHAISDIKGITTTTSVFSSNMVAYTNNVILKTGETYAYTMNIQNMGTLKDTFDLSLSQGAFLYDIRNVANTASIKTLSAGAGITETFLVVVTIPESGISNGLADTITVSARSQANPGISYTSQLITETPYVSYSMQAITGDLTLKPGQTQNYIIQLQNSGLSNDTYDLSQSSGNFAYAIRNASDDKNIRTISVNAGQTIQYLLKVTVPLTGISNGQSDTITINSISQSNDSVSNSLTLVTSIPSFSHNLVKLSNDTTIYPGRSFNYLVAIENTGLTNDTYNLSHSSGSFNYKFRDASDTAEIHSISVGAGLSSTFIVKASVPLTGASNGQAETITVNSTSQENSLDTKNIQISTMTPATAFSLSNLSGDSLVYPGKEKTYVMALLNTSLINDTYNLSISGGAWSYSIRNASDTMNLYSISMNAGVSKTFLIKVIVPVTGVTNGASESINVNAVSQGNSQASQSVQITSSTPMFSYTLQQVTSDATLAPGQSFEYTYVISNTSAGDDTYSLSLTGGNWLYSIKNASNTANINTISVGAGLTNAFLVRVSVPLTISSGATDTITVNTVSQSNAQINNSDLITTQSPTYSFSMQNITGNSTIYSGQTHNYIIQIQNSGTGNDTIHLAVDGGSFDYSIRNALDTTNINSLKVDSGATVDFIVKVDAPVTGIANGQGDSITLRAASLSGITQNIQILTSTPACSFSMTPTVNTASILSGQTNIYQINITNSGLYTDTYALSINGGSWSYSILSIIDNSEISTISVSPGETKVFYVKAKVPANVSTGGSDAINVLAVSMCNPTVNASITLTTSVPLISYSIQTPSNKEMVFLGQAHTYRIDIFNSGTRAETFDLSITSAAFKYAIRNDLDSADIKSINVPAGYTSTYIAKVFVPTLGVANAQSDTVTTQVSPQGNPSDIKQIELVTTSPTFAANIQQISPSDIVYPGQSKDYIIQVDNTGASIDTYSLSLKGGNWKYAIRNSEDIATLETITVESGYTGIFLVKVSVPLTNVANGASDTVTINAMSQGNNSINFSTQITTTTPTFSYNISNLSTPPDIYPGGSFNYEVQIENTGANSDTYDLSLTGGQFSYEIRNLDDYANLNAISVDSGATNSFVVKVTVPKTGISNAQSDTITINSISQGNGVVYTSCQIVTQTPTFSIKVVGLDNKALVYPGKSYSYPVYIENTGSGFDAYNLLVSGGNWDYQIRNISNTANIDTISMSPGVSNNFIVKVTVPFTGVANGASDTITVKAVSQGLNIVSSSIKMTTDSPYYEFNLNKLTPNKTIFLGQTFDYHIELNNTGSANDCYSLTVIGGNWPYTLRNAKDNTDITSIPMPAKYSDTFRLRVTMPQTGVASGEAETVTVKAQSQNNQTVADQVLVSTASPFYDITATRLNFPKTVNTEETYNYEIELNNLGNIIDSYTLSLDGGIWTYAIRNASDTTDLTSITIGADTVEKIIVGASVPITNVSNGDNDTITLSVLSKGNPSVSLSVPFVLTAANYNFNMVKNFDNAQISPERSAVYELQINNTETSNDSYYLTVDDSNWTYTFRNPSDTKDITSIYVPAMSSQEFFVKVTVPQYGVSEGDQITAMVRAVSINKASIKDHVVISSRVAGTSNKFAFNAMRETIDSTVNIGRSYDYKVQIVNDSISADEFHLSTSGGNWHYSIRNQNDISDIGCMTVLGESNRSFIVRVTVPTQNISAGDTDTVNVRLQSNTTNYGADFQITTTAKKFYALSFVGSEYITVGHHNELNVNPITIETWIKPTSLSSAAQDNPIISKLGTNSGWELRAHTYPEFLVAIDGTDYTVGSSAPITPNTWTHLAATYDNNDINIYINGVLKGTNTVQGSITDNTVDLSIGRSSLNTSKTFTGFIDDVRIWKFARSSEMLSDFIELNLLGTENGLIANWPFEEGTGNAVSDISSNAMNTTLSNAQWLTSPVTLSDATYSFLVKSTNATIEQGKSYQYPVVLQNAGPTIDAYTITFSGGDWAYTVLDATGTSVMNSITLSSGYTGTFLVEVNLPLTSVCYGDVDNLTLTVSSKNDTTLIRNTLITSTATYAIKETANDFAFQRIPLTEYDNIQMGDSLYYLYKVQNTGKYCNDFSMKNMSGRMDYSLYGEMDKGPVDQFTLRPGENKIVVLKATAIQGNYTTGDRDLTILKLVAHGDSVTEYQTVTTTVAETLPDELIEFKDGQQENDIPMAINMNYNYCQSIYLKEEIQRSGEISSVYFEYSQGESATYTQVDIYMGFTQKREFTSTSDWLFLTQLTKVYSGNINIDASTIWDGILLDTPFVYDTDKGHLVVAIDDNSGQGKAFGFYSSPSVMNRSLVASDNITNPDPNAPPTNGVLTSAYPNIRLYLETYDPYGIEMTRSTYDSGIGISQSFNYSLTIENKGLNPDFYTFTTNGAWTYQFRNPADTADITGVSLGIGASKSVWLKVTVPSSGVSEGDADHLSLTVGSRGNPQKIDKLKITSFALNENTIEIQKDRLSHQSLPIEPEKVYTYSQSIYNQSLIDRQGVISSIAFQYNGYSSWQDDIDIYMGHSPKAAFDNDTDWLPDHRLTKVYSGPMAVSKNQNWIKISLDNPFFYNNTDNLVIAIDENKTNAHSAHDTFFCSSSPTNTGLVYTQDIYYAIDPTPEFPSQGQTKSVIPNIRMEIPPVGNDQVQLVRLNEDNGVEMERTYNYKFKLFNNGPADTINLALNNGSWPYTIRNIMDTQDINSIAMDAKSLTEVIVKVFVPYNGVNEGDSDTTVFTVTSQANNQMSKSASLRTTAVETLADVKAQVGTGSSTDKGIPIKPEANYTYSQSIYLAPSINKYGYIQRIKYHYNGNSAWTDYIRLYMGHTKLAQFTSNSDWIPSSDLTQVYAGGLTTQASEGWVVITLDEPFLYNKRDNLVIGVYKPSNNAITGADGFYCSQSNINQTLLTTSFVNPHQPLINEGQLLSAYPNIDLDIKGSGYSLDLSQITPDASIDIGGRYVYAIGLKNLGINDDVFDLSLSGGSWNYKTTSPHGRPISSIFVPGELQKPFMIRVQLPPDVSIGDSDSITVTARSQGNPRKVKQVSLTSDAITPLIDIYSGTEINKELPVDPISFYTYSQSIYLKPQIGRAGMVSKVSYEYNGQRTWSDDIVIYMGHTPQNEFTTGYDWLPYDQLTQVYQGSLTVTTNAQWIDITLDRPFYYNNIDNLVIAMDENNVSNHPKEGQFLCTKVDTNQSIVYTQDLSYSINPDPLSPLHGTPRPFYPNVKLIVHTVPVDNFQMIKLTPDADVAITDSFEYELKLLNNGPVDDAFSLSLSTANWTYQIRNADNSSDVTAVTITSGQTLDILLIVSVPENGVTVGDTDCVTITAMSSKFDHLVVDIPVTTTALKKRTHLTAQTGHGTTVNIGLPLNPKEQHTFSQSIYRRELINKVGFIQTVKYYYNGSQAFKDHIVLFMATTTKPEFKNNNDWLQYDELTVVYNGLIQANQAPGWVDIPLEEPFFYNMEEHLVIGLYAPTNSTNVGTNDFYCTESSYRASLLTNDLVDLNRKVVLTGSVVSSYPNLMLDLIGIDYYFDISPPMISSADVQTGGGYQYEFQLNNKGLKNDTFDFTLSSASLDYTIFDKDGVASTSISMISETTNQFYVQVAVPETGFPENASESLSVSLVSQGNSSHVHSITVTTIASLPTTEKLVPIAEGYGYTSLVPINAKDEYTYAQTIYTPDQIGRKGYISMLHYYYSGNTEIQTDLTIYLGNTTRKEFNTISDWIPTNQMTQVYSGTHTFTTGINIIKFDNLFSYDGINNLVIAIDENSSSKQSGQCSFDVTHISDNRTLSIDGSTNPDPSSPPDGILQSLYPNVKVRFKEPYDFVVTASTTETVVNCGKSYTFTAQVENIGRLDDTYHLDVHNGTKFNYTLRDLDNSQDITQVSASSDSTVRFLVKVEIPIVGVEDGDIEDIWLESMSAGKPQYSEGVGLTTTARVIPLKVAMPVYDWTSQDIQTTGRFMNSIWGSSGSDLAAVGSDGKIMHYDGTSWTEKPSHTTNQLHSIWGFSANEMYAVGERGTILKYNGTSWSKMPLTQPNTLYHIWGDATDNMYAVGESGLILNYDGNSWTEMRSPTFNDLFWIWGDNQNNMFIVGAAGTILSYIDNKWISMTSPVANDLVTIWGISGSSLYAAGSGGTIIHYDGNQWSDFMSPIREDIFGIWGSQDNDMYASTIFGQVYHYDGNTWTKVFQVSDLSFQGAWGLSQTQVFAVGSNTSVYEYDGVKWSAKLSDNLISADINDVLGFSNSNIYAVGNYGTFFHYDGSKWSELKSGEYENINCLWGVSANSLFAAGDKGQVIKYDGASFININTGVEKNLYAMWGSSSSDFYIVGKAGTILHYSNNQWSRLTPGVTNSLFGIWGTSGSDIYIVGTEGLILHYDGNSFTTMTNSDTSDLNSIWGISANNIYAVGNNTVLHYDGSNWVKDADLNNVFTDVYGSSGSNIYAVGITGIVYKYNGSNWTLLNNITNKNLYSVWTSGTKTVIVGQEKTMITYDNSSFTDMNPTPTVSASSAITQVYYSAIWGDSLKNIVVVGENGTAMHYTGVSWNKKATFTNNHLSDVWGTSSTNIYATGQDGTICHYDGNSWSTEPRTTTNHLNSIYGFATDDIFTVGDSATIMHFNGSNWVSMTCTTHRNLQSVWGSSPNNVYAVGDYGTMINYDGTSWKKVDLGLYDFLYCVWGFASDDIYISGASGLIMHYDGTNWTKMRTGISTSGIVNIKGTPQRDLFAVGEGGLLLQYKDNVWRQMTSYITLDLNDCWAFEDNLFVVGTNESIYHARIEFSPIADQKMTIVDERLYDNIEFRIDNIDISTLSIDADSSNKALLSNDNITFNCTSNNCVMKLTPNAVCQQDETIVTLIGTDASGEYKTRTFTILVNDSTSGSCTEPDVGVLKIDDGPVHNYVGANVQVPVLIRIPQGDTTQYDPMTTFGFDIVYSDQDLFYVDYDTSNANAAIPFESNGILTVDASTSGILHIQASTIGQGYQATKAGDYLINLNFQVNMEADQYDIYIRNISGDILDWPIDNGVFTAGYNGDINGDNMITPMDALCAFEKFMNWDGQCANTTCNIIPCSEVQCDVNADGACTPADAFCIMNKYMQDANCIDGK